MTFEHRVRWRFIGIELGVNIGTLDAIAKNHNDVEDCLLDLISQWLRGSSPRPTRSTLTMALQSRHVTGGATSIQGVYSYVVSQYIYSDNSVSCEWICDNIKNMHAISSYSS